MKFLKRRLNRELNAIVPPLTGRTEERGTAKKKRLLPSVRFRRLISAACVSLAAVCAVVFTVLFIPAAPASYGYMTLEINPEVAFVTQDRVIVRTVALNSDADVVLSGDFAQTLAGKPVEEGAAAFADRAAQLGYLDLNGNAAVRVSAEKGETSLLQNVESALGDYFMKQGAYVAVASRELTSEQIVQWFGGTENGLQTLQEMPQNYAERQAAGLSAAELADSYRENVVNGGLKSYLYSSLTTGLDELERRIRLLDELIGLNEQIEEHADNPITILPAKDYFTVKKYYPNHENYSADFGKLMSQADEVYNEYLSLGEKPIEYKEMLLYMKESLTSVLNSIHVDELRGLLEDFSDFLDSLQYICGVLDSFGNEVDRINDLLSGIPQTTEEYLAYTAEAVSLQAEALADRFLSDYGREREPLSSDEYRMYTAEMTAQYGSLNGYFEWLKSGG